MNLINILRKNNIEVWINNQRIKVSFPKSLRNLDKYRNLIKENKESLTLTLIENKIFSKNDFNNLLILKFRLDAYPLSFAQERLWFIEQYEGGSNAYHIPMLVSLKEGVNEEALKQSILSIVSRHEVLRSVFRQDNEGNDYQVVLNDSLVINEYSYKDIGISKQIDKDINTPFD
uniref:condensation domain-containing protein n=1 Tax=Francisella sp. SYW-9 TaxID=2610888 RepID=UPI00123C98BB